MLVLGTQHVIELHPRLQPLELRQTRITPWDCRIPTVLGEAVVNHSKRDIAAAVAPQSNGNQCLRIKFQANPTRWHWPLPGFSTLVPKVKLVVTHGRDETNNFRHLSMLEAPTSCSVRQSRAHALYCTLIEVHIQNATVLEPAFWWVNIQASNDTPITARVSTQIV